MNTRKQITTAWLAALVMMAAADANAQERQRIIISIPDRKLTLIEAGGAVKTYDVAVGKPSTPSPQGELKVISRIKNPAWYGPGGQIAPPGKGNPVGTRWIGLSKKGYGIHGTNQPD